MFAGYSLPLYPESITMCNTVLKQPDVNYTPLYSTEKNVFIQIWYTNRVYKNVFTQIHIQKKYLFPEVITSPFVKQYCKLQ